MYYLYESNSTLYLVHSPLGAMLTMRLLLHVTPQEGDRVYGCVEDSDLTWFNDDKPRVVVNMSMFVEPKPFNDDKRGNIWALLHKADATALYKYWSSLDTYKQVPEGGKPNYFRNSVDAFKNNMEKKWFKQVK